MSNEQLFFDTLKEAHDEYIVKYAPPNPGYRFSTLSLTYTIDEVRPPDVASAMEGEAKSWLERFPVPVMVTAFDSTGSVIPLDEERPEDHLLAFVADSGDGELHWRLLEDRELPSVALDSKHLLHVFSDVDYRTSGQLRESANAYAKQLRLAWYVVFVWAVIVPAGIAVLSFFSPLWVAVLALGYSLWKAFVKGMKLAGRWPKSRAETAQQDQERQIRHHHFHCERNPEGFRRLMLENFRRWERERVQQESAAVRGGANRDAG